MVTPSVPFGSLSSKIGTLPGVTRRTYQADRLRGGWQSTGPNFSQLTSADS